METVHSTSLATSTAIAGYYVKNFIAPLEVVKVLKRSGIRCVLVGAHGLAGWLKQGRGTQDIDVIVSVRFHKKAVKALVAAFRYLDIDDQEVVTRLRNRETNDVLIDVMKTNQPLFREVFKNTHEVVMGRMSYEVPSLEMALALKFAPMISLNRTDTKKLQDAVDFRQMVEVNPSIQLDKLETLGELVYPGGGKEIVQMVETVRSGGKLLL